MVLVEFKDPHGLIEVMQEALRDVLEGDLKGVRKGFVVYLDDREGDFNVGWYAGGIDDAEMNTMLDCAKQILLKDMGYV